ncbi:MAG: transglycosylase SLT domain-containing protein [Ardenticatenales bacterium]|nr:transglycosylase SLT domain-containing protein [Ardenticatenales bacterium]
MTTHSAAHPIHGADVALPPLVGVAVGHLKFVAFVAACLVLSAGARVLNADAPSGAGPTTAAVFFPQATGTLRERAALADAPGGAPGRLLGVGEIVAVGGSMAGTGLEGTGLEGNGAYWVEVVTPAGASAFGFLPVDAVIITAGRVPELRYDAAAPAEWLAPTGPSSAVPAEPGGAAEVSVASAADARAVTIAWLPDSVLAHRNRIAAVASAAHVDPDLVAILVLVESGGNPDATSSAGARGLMQLMPGTALEMANRAGMHDFELAALADADTNLTLGTAYIASMLGAFGRADDPDWQRSVELAAAAYNGGPGHVGQHLTTGQPLFAETASYQRWVGGMWRERRDAESATYRSWLAAGGQRLVDAASDRIVLAAALTP